MWHVFLNVIFFRKLDYCTCVDSLTLPFLPHFHCTSMGEGYQMECRKIETPSPGLAGATCDEEWLWTARTPGRDGWHSYGIPTHVCKKDLFRHRFHVVWVVLDLDNAGYGSLECSTTPRVHSAWHICYYSYYMLYIDLFQQFDSGLYLISRIEPYDLDLIWSSGMEIMKVEITHAGFADICSCTVKLWSQMNLKWYLVFLQV